MNAKSQLTTVSVHSYYIFVQNHEKYENKRKLEKRTDRTYPAVQISSSVWVNSGRIYVSFTDAA